MGKNEGYELELKEEAISDIQEAFEWLSEEEAEWGEAFLEEVDEAETIITRMPEAFPNKYKDYREYNLDRYPYVVIYSIKGKKVTVFSVFHTSRDPQEKYPE